MDKYFLQNLNQHLELFKNLHQIEPQMNKVIDACTNSIKHGGKIMFCGNGGSAADSQHLAAEFTGRYSKDRKPLAGLALSTDTSALTCIGNDYTFDDIFVRQVLALGKTGDCLIGISTSGNSRNVINAINACPPLGITSIGLLGKGGGKLRDTCDLSVIIPSDVTARIQEAHIFIGHIICGAVELALGLIEESGT